jgi:hypothetical protein
VAIGGSGAGGAITTADRIVAIGDGALGGAAQSQGNTGVGYASLYNATGAKNTAFGYQAANTVTSGTENTVVGWDADVTGSGAVNQTVIGSEAIGNQNYGTVIGNVGMFQFASKEYTAHQSDGEDLKSASGGEGLKLPAYSIIKSISVVVTQLSNLGTFNICLVLADESVGIGDNTAFTNPVEVLGAGVTATLSGNSSSAVDIALGSGAILKQSYHMDEAINVGATDKFLHLAQAGTGNGDTNPTTNALLNIMVEYIGLD